MSVNNHQAGRLCMRALVDELIPEHIRFSNPKLIAILKEYMDFIEHEHEAAFFLNNLNYQRDIDNVEERFLKEIQKEIGAPIPQTFATEPRLFYKQITDLYLSRGTADSIRAFFKLLYNDQVEIHYPVEEMLIPSDGKWFDLTSQILADKTKFTPLFTYSVPLPTDRIEGLDDDGKILQYNNPVVFVNDIHRTDITFEVKTNNTNGNLDYALIFDTPVQALSTVEIFVEGLFTTNDGLLSNYRYIQDSFYYQKFSYVLRTGTDIELWKSAFDRLIHPAGFIFFGEVVLFLNGKSGTMPLIQPGRQVGGLPVPIVIPPVAAGLRLTTQPSKELIIGPLRDTDNPLGPEQYLDRIKFYINSPVGHFGDFTFEDAINKAIDIQIDAEITIS